MFASNTATVDVAMTVLLEVRNLTKVFALGPGADLVAVSNASLDGRLAAKHWVLSARAAPEETTLGRCILRLIEPTEGSVLLSGNEIIGLKGNALRALRPHMQLVFQDPFASLNPRLTVERDLA